MQVHNCYLSRIQVLPANSGADASGGWLDSLQAQLLRRGGLSDPVVAALLGDGVSRSRRRFLHCSVVSRRDVEDSSPLGRVHARRGRTTVHQLRTAPGHHRRPRYGHDRPCAQAPRSASSLRSQPSECPIVLTQKLLFEQN